MYQRNTIISALNLLSYERKSQTCLDINYFVYRCIFFSGGGVDGIFEIVTGGVTISRPESFTSFPVDEKLL